MNKILKNTLLAASILTLSASAFSQGTIANPQLKSILEKELATINPDFKIESIQPSKEIPGYFEVVHNFNNIMYSSPDGNYILQGEIVDLQKAKNITSDRKYALSKIDFKQLPKTSTVIKKGKGERTLAIFSDPNCPYCKMIEKELAQLDNVTIRLYPYPILSPESKTMSVSVLCSSKPGETWKSWMLNAVNIPTQSCKKGEDQVSTNLAFGKKYSITATPTLFFENGDRVTGALQANKINEIFELVKNSKNK